VFLFLLAIAQILENQVITAAALTKTIAVHLMLIITMRMGHLMTRMIVKIIIIHLAQIILLVGFAAILAVVIFQQTKNAVLPALKEAVFMTVEIGTPMDAIISVTVRKDAAFMMMEQHIHM
jgi:hypothetical protein